MAYVSVPKDLNKIKSKFMFGLTGKQLLCVVLGSVFALPAFWFSRGVLGNGPAMILLFLLMSPFGFVAFYEKNGLTAMQMVVIIVRKNLAPIKRPHKTQNLYTSINNLIKHESEVSIAKKYKT